MKHLYIIILIFSLTIQGVYAQTEINTSTKKDSYITNILKVPLRDKPGFFQKKTYSVMQGVVGKILEEKKVEGFTWLHIEYTPDVSGWIHKKLSTPYIDTFTLENGETYSVYYKTPETQVQFLEQSIGDTIESSISGEIQEIVWITTDFRTPSTYTKYPWPKDQIQYIDSNNSQLVDSQVNIPQVYDFRKPVAIKTNYPWNIPEEIIATYQDPLTGEISEKVMMVTNDFRTPIVSKIYYPWVKQQFTYASGSTEAQEPEITYNLYDFRKPIEQKISYPWVKQQFTYASGSTDSSITEKVVTMIDSIFRKDEAPHYSIPWNKQEEIELSSASEQEPETTTTQDITSKFGPEKPAGWTLTDFIDF